MSYYCKKKYFIKNSWQEHHLQEVFMNPLPFVAIIDDYLGLGRAGVANSISSKSLFWEDFAFCCCSFLLPARRASAGDGVISCINK
jgi:hypothetical protein